MEDHILQDSRIEKIIRLIMAFASGNLEAKEQTSDKNDELDGIIGGLNMLGEELFASTVSRNFLDKILKAMIDGLIITDTNLMIQEINPAVESMLGYKANELVGTSIKNIYHSDSSFFDQLADELQANGFITWFETTCLSKLHLTKSVSVSIFAIRDYDDVIHNYIFIIHDISEKKRKETEILTINQKMKSILEAIPDLLFEIDLNGRLYNYHSPRVESEMLLLIDCTGKNLSDIFPRDASELIMASVDIANENGWSTGAQFELAFPDGNKWFEISVNRMQVIPNEEQHFIVLARDTTKNKMIELKLQRNMILLNEAQRLGHLGSWELDLINGDLTWSDETFRIFELDKRTFIPSFENFLNVIHPDDRGRVRYAYAKSLESRQPCEIVHRLLFSNNRIKWVHEHCSNFFDESGRPVRSVGAVQDITEQRLIEEELHIAAITFNSQEGIFITNADGIILRVNDAFQSITGYTSDEVLGKNPNIMASGRHDKVFYEKMWQQLQGMGTWNGEIWNRHKKGHIYPQWATITAIKNEEGTTVQYVAIFSDITERKKAEDEIHHLAFYDALTNIPNRRLLLDRFRLALSMSARNNQYGAVIFLDLDKFKNLNDIMGHEYGDRLLIEVARRIEGCVREVDTVARLGGDEFVVLLEEIGDEQEQALQKTALVAEKIKNTLALPYRLWDYEYFSSSSIGISLYKGTDKSVADLLKSADMAMYQAKESGRNTIKFFDPIMQKTVETHAVIETNLRTAVHNQRLQLYYQIQVDNDFQALGAEALIRWNDAKLGFISTSQFIRIAEETTLILDIGHWVMESACKQLAIWQKDKQKKHLSIAINVSAKQFILPNFVEQIKEIIQLYQINPSRLKLELTEHVLLNDTTSIIAKMHALKTLGVQLSIDDFGTGYSSLSYLRQLPIHQLKIDQSFIWDIAADPNDAILVKTIINLAHNFNLHVIAEGVETEAQMSFLSKNGCMAYQGYLFGRPVPIEEFEMLLGQTK